MYQALGSPGIVQEYVELVLPLHLKHLRLKSLRESCSEDASSWKVSLGFRAALLPAGCLQEEWAQSPEWSPSGSNETPECLHVSDQIWIQVFRMWGIFALNFWVQKEIRGLSGCIRAEGTGDSSVGIDRCHSRGVRTRGSTFFRIPSKPWSLPTIPPLEGLKGLEVPLLESRGLSARRSG